MRKLRTVFRRIHEWHLKTFLGETEWRFPLRHGYVSFDRHLTGEVRRIPKWHFRLPFDYRVYGKPYGYWDEDSVLIRSRRAPDSVSAFFGTSRISHFDGQIADGESDTCLSGRYRLTYPVRWFVMICLYAPFVILSYATLTLVVTTAGKLWTGDVSGVLVDAAIFSLFPLGTLAFWAMGYAIGRFHVYSTRGDRQVIHDVLRRASGAQDFAGAKT